MGSTLGAACSPACGTTHLPSHISFRTRSTLLLPIDKFFFLSPSIVQFVRNVGITHGDESRVGYYVGLLVCLKAYPLHASPNFA